MGVPQINKMKIPDYKIYKIDGIKELEWVRDELNKKGLKDPWLRNEVWRYEGWRGYGKEALASVFRGFKYAAPLVVATIIIKGITSTGKGHEHDH